jgi:MFS family permease
VSTAGAPPLFTRRFFLMCGFTFTVFISVFLLLPAMPYRIIEVGGTRAQAGLFLGFLTYSSAFSAPLTGVLADRLGKPALLAVCSLVICGFSAAYALSASVLVPLLLSLVHGVFWSALLNASSAYLIELVPTSRRAEGIAYWGLSTIIAMAVAPEIGFRIHEHFGWGALCAVVGGLNLLMAAIAWTLPGGHAPLPSEERRSLIAWRVLAVSFTLFLYSFGYGAVTSFVALHADAHGVTPRGVFFTAFALVVCFTRPFSGPLGDRVGHERILLPALALIALGLALLAYSTTLVTTIAAALVFGTGFGSAYPVFAAFVLQHVHESRRGAAFGAMVAAFDTGIGSGSMVTGWLVQHHGFARAFGTSAAIAALAIPFFLLSRRWLEEPA